MSTAVALECWGTQEGTPFFPHFGGQELLRFCFVLGGTYGLERISRRALARASEPRFQVSVAAATLPTTLTAFFSLAMFNTALLEGCLPTGIVGQTIYS